MLTIKLLTVSKRKNSTLQPDTTGAREESVSLKQPTSEEAPSFLLNWESGAFPYNYLVWDSHYYWVNNVTYERNNLIRLDCTLDVLATYKSYILSSTQFVAYSNVASGDSTKLFPDRRIMTSANAAYVAQTDAAVPILSQSGYYVLSVLGQNGCELYQMSRSDLQQLLASVQSRNVSGMVNDIINSVSFDPDDMGLNFESLTEALVHSDILGNAFGNAVSCIRSCIWVPFNSSYGAGTPKTIYLGNYDTNITATPITAPIVAGSVSVPVNRHYTYPDWRQVTCEDLYLYLPLVGVVNLNTDELAGVTSIDLDWSAAITDGTISYQVSTGAGYIIGTYGGSCCANFPLGINQQASAGQIVNTAVAGLTKITGGLAMGSIPTIDAAANAVLTAYEVADLSHSTSPTVIGGMGGGSGSRLDLTAHVLTRAYDTVIEPSAMAATMGVPTQKPLTLSSCSGYCQCANAHVAAPAHGDSLNVIDMFLNSGFFIE